MRDLMSKQMSSGTLVAGIADREYYTTERINAT